MRGGFVGLQRMADGEGDRSGRAVMARSDAPSRTHARVPSPMKLTPEVQAIIVTAVRTGASVGFAAELAGVSRRSVFNWMKDVEPFATAVSKARAGYAEDLRRKIGDSEDWKAAAWLLERQFPDEFSKVERHEVTAEAVRAEVIEAPFEDVEAVLMADVPKH